MGDNVKISFKKAFYVLLIFSILFVGLNIVSAQDNATQIIQDDLVLSNPDEGDVVEEVESDPVKTDTQIEAKNVDSYYKEKTDFVSYLKDTNGTPIKNKQLNVFLNEKEYNRTTDDAGKITLALNLKPDTYRIVIKFAGDENFTSSEANSLIKIKKAPLAIKMNNYNTYYKSDVFFKVKVYNKVTGNAAEGIRVAFKVYSTKTKKYAYFYATTNKKGVATLNKNFNVGSYRISAQIKDSKNKKYISPKNSKNKVTMKVKPNKEIGCCSFYLQVSGTEAIGGYRRDGTESDTILVKSYKLNGIPAVKKYKTSSGYFVHLIVTANGWMAASGGIDSPSTCKAIEKLTGDMFKSKKIKTASLKKIQGYKRNLNFGHFSIKAPNGDFAVVWKDGYITGKLKPGEYLSSPNFRSYYRHGTYSQFGSDLNKAGIKVGATDKYGVNRRDIVIIHWKATTDKNYKTTAAIKAFAANDNGKLVGKSTAWLKDNLYFKDKYFSKNKLPYSPDMKYLGVHNFGNIDKLIKTQTKISAPDVTNQFNQTAYFKVTVKNKKTGKIVPDIKVTIKVSNKTNTMKYIVKTDKKGVIKLNTKDLGIGSYTVAITPANNKYIISAKSKIVVK